MYLHDTQVLCLYDQNNQNCTADITYTGKDKANNNCSLQQVCIFTYSTFAIVYRSECCNVL